MVKIKTVLAAALPASAAASLHVGQIPLAPAGSENIMVKNPLTPEFNKFVQGLIDEWKIPGLSISVVDGNEVFAEGYGYSELPDTPTTPETLFYAGSTTKAHTAATLSHIIHNKTYPELIRGWLTPVSSILRDDFVLQDEWATNHVTLDDAISHRTGMSGHDNSWQNVVDGKPATSRDAVRNLRNLPMTTEPRTEFLYNNLMYVSLSHLIETLTGKGLGEVMSELIWKPLGMHSTYFKLEDAKNAPFPLATSYQWKEEEQKYIKLPFLEAERLTGAGAIISNVLDYAKWLQCLIHKKEPFSEVVHSDIRTPRFLFDPSPGLGTDVGLYGLGWMRTTLHGHVAYQHSGSTYTHCALVWWMPELKFGIVALSNGAAISNLAEEVVIRRLIEEKLNTESPTWSTINEKFHDQIRALRNSTKHAKRILFPDSPEHPLPPSVDPSKLAGEFRSVGYGSLSLSSQSNSDRGSLATLYANRADVAWGQEWRFEHVTGDYWVLYIIFLPNTGVFEFHGIKFLFGVDGTVEGFEMNMYDRLNGIFRDKIYFHKITS